MRRVTGVLRHPRATMAEVVRHPAFITTWVVVLLVAAVCGGLLLSTPIGQQALVDERVRVTEALGGRVDDAAYDRLRSDPPVSNYLTSGGRLLLTPPVTLLVAAGLVGLARFDGARVTFVTALAIGVHATVVLALQQVVAAPLHYVNESLTSPTNLAGLLRVFDEGSAAGPALRHHRRLRVVVDVAAGRGVGGGHRSSGAAIHLAAAGRLSRYGRNRRGGVCGGRQRLRTLNCRLEAD